MSGTYSFLIVLFTFYFTQQLWISSPHFSVFMEYTFCLLETVLTKQTNWWGTWCDNKIVLSLLWILPCTIFLEAAFYADLLPFSWRTSKPTLTWESQLPSEWSCQALLLIPFLSKQIFFLILWKNHQQMTKLANFCLWKKPCPWTISQILFSYCYLFPHFNWDYVGCKFVHSWHLSCLFLC